MISYTDRMPSIWDMKITTKLKYYYVNLIHTELCQLDLKLFDGEKLIINGCRVLNMIAQIKLLKYIYILIFIKF